MPSDLYDQNGRPIVNIVIYDDGQETSVDISGTPNLESKSVTPSDSSQTVYPSENYDGLSSVQVGAIPSQYIVPTGTLNINQNGSYDVRQYASTIVAVGINPSPGTSSEQAKQYHSINIGDKNTWDDWHLVPTSRPKFNMPNVKTNYVDIPGGDGVLDLTTALTGRPTYGNRQGSFEFLVMNDYGEWYERYSDIATYLHGKEFKAILDDDPDWYYEGRFTLNEWKSDKDWSKIVINYNVGPYKKSILSSGDKWLWDTFQFEDYIDPITGENVPQSVIEGTKNIIVNGTFTVHYVGDVYESAPIITCSKYQNVDFSMSVTINGRTFRLTQGTNVLEAITFSSGDNVLVFNSGDGAGIVSIENTGGRL